jgi:hypothetical protein
MLRICLRLCSDKFTDQMTVLLHKGLEEEQAKMYQDFCLPRAATRQGLHCSWCAAVQPKPQEVGCKRFAGAVSGFSFLQFPQVCGGAVRGSVSRVRCFVEIVTRRIALNAQDLAGAGQSRHTVLLWQEFLGGCLAVVCVMRGHSHGIAIVPPD